MSQPRPLIDTLQQELRKQRITYKPVSHALELSETSVKRLFVEESFSVKRLEKTRELLYLAKEMNALNLESESLPLEQRFGTSQLLAFSPWEIEVFETLRRVPDARAFGQ